MFKQWEGWEKWEAQSQVRDITKDDASSHLPTCFPLFPLEQSAMGCTEAARAMRISTFLNLGGVAAAAFLVMRGRDSPSATSLAHHETSALAFRFGVTPHSSSGSAASGTPYAYNHVAFRAGCPYRPCSTWHAQPPQGPRTHPPPHGGRGNANAGHASEYAGCSKTPPYVRTAVSAAEKQPPSSPFLCPHRASMRPASRHHREHGGCATTGCGPAYRRASRVSSQSSTPLRLA